MRSWTAACVHALRAAEGEPGIFAPDDCATATDRRRKSEPMEINNSYLEMAEHYGCAVVPARVGAFGGKLCEACDDEPYDGMIFKDKIGMCIDAEIEARSSGKIDKAAKTACFKAGGACVGGSTTSPTAA